MQPSGSDFYSVENFAHEPCLTPKKTSITN